VADPTPASITRCDRRRFSRLLVTSRLLLLALAAAAAVAAFVPDPPASPGAAPVRYRCPMHPAVVAPAPGGCPICGMALVADEAGAVARAADEVDAARLGRVERRVVSEPVRVPAWVDAGGVVAVLYRDDVIGLAAGDAAMFYPATSPSRGIAVRRTAAPVEDRDGTTVAARFAVADGEAPARAEGWLVVPAPPRELLVVPVGAVLDAPAGSYVLVRTSGELERRSVQVGRIHHGAVAVLAGLSAGDEVVVTGAFVVDAELGPGRAP
jgi:heavy metal-binding protein